MMFHFNLHHITLILNGYLSNISCSPLPFGLLSSQVSGNGITFSHVELPIIKKKKTLPNVNLILINLNISISVRRFQGTSSIWSHFGSSCTYRYCKLTLPSSDICSLAVLAPWNFIFIQFGNITINSYIIT